MQDQPDPYLIPGSPFPYVMTINDMMAVFQVGYRTFYRGQKAGKYRKFELRSRGHGRPENGSRRYNGILVKQHIEAGLL